MRLTVARRRAPNECRLSDGVAEQSVEWKDARIREVKAHPDLVRLERVGERLGLRVMRARGLGAVAGREGRTTQYVLGHVTPGQRRHRREVLRTIHAIGGDLVVQYRRYVRAYALRNPVPGVDADDLEGESALAVPLALARLDLAGAGECPAAHKMLLGALKSALWGCRTAVVRALRAGSCGTAGWSLDRPDEDGHTGAADLADTRSLGPSREDADWLRAMLSRLDGMSPRQADVVRLRYGLAGDEMTLEDARHYLAGSGSPRWPAAPLSKEYVRQCEVAGMDRLRNWARQCGAVLR